jgi:hypothetical protein
VSRAGGGGGAGFSTGGSASAGGGQGNFEAAGTAGSVNTGGGGGGGAYKFLNPGETFYNGGNGGSGVVILRYLSSRTITLGAGLTGSTATDGNYKVTTITAGTGNVSWA